MKAGTVYYCPTEADGRKLMIYLDSKGLRWVGGESLLEVFRSNPEGTCYHIRKGGIFYGSLEYAEKCGYDIIRKIPGMLPLKEEYERDFKKMFRLNKLPSELSQEQIDQMKSQKVYNLWIQK